jgi:hypothetical protein
LQELSGGAQYLGNVPTLPSLVERLSQPPEVTELSGGLSGRKVTLHFSEELNEALIDNEVTRSACMASLTYTLTTFLPGVVGVEVYIGDERVPSVSPSSPYTDQQSIEFADGLQQRSDFGALLLGYCRLYFATDGGKLAAVNRPVPYFQVKNPRYLLLELKKGPKTYDTVTGLKDVLPQEWSDKDLLGISLTGDTMLVNF